MNTFTAPCIHLSTYYRELKSFPRDQITVISSNPCEIYSCNWLELIGKNLEEIISNIRISGDLNHYNRLNCTQTTLNSSTIILTIWKYNRRIFVFEFDLCDIWHRKPLVPFYVDYELRKMWEIVGNTKALLNMTGVDEMTYQELTKYMQDFTEDFVLLKSVY